MTNEERSQFILVYGNLVGFFALLARDCVCFSLIMQVAANLIQISVLINLVLFWFEFRFMQLLACASPGFVLIFMPLKEPFKLSHIFDLLIHNDHHSFFRFFSS